jgi:hypothetical protein
MAFEDAYEYYSPNLFSYNGRDNRARWHPTLGWSAVPVLDLKKLRWKLADG